MAEDLLLLLLLLLLLQLHLSSLLLVILTLSLPKGRTPALARAVALPLVGFALK
jgi:hypothetical protein